MRETKLDVLANIPEWQQDHMTDGGPVLAEGLSVSRMWDRV